MMDSEVQRLLDTKLGVLFEERDIALGREYGATISKMNARGMLYSSACAFSVVGLYTRELEIRVKTAFSQLTRIATALERRDAEQMNADAKQFLEDLAQHQASELNAKMKSQLPFKSGTGYGVNPDVEIATVLDRIVRDTGAEIDLWSAVLNRTSQAPTGGTHINVSGSVGIMQAGDYASVSHSVVMTGDDKDAIAKALNEVSELLDQSGENEAFANEVKQLVQDCLDELTKEQPNLTRLKSGLLGVGTAIQTIAALGPAYQALKWAVTPFGITLP